MTDTGIVTPQAACPSPMCGCLPSKATTTPRCCTKDPIPTWSSSASASDKGHLSNEQAAEELASLLGSRLQAVAAMHVSENNNEYDLALRGFRAVMEREGCAARVICGYQGRLSTLA
ncbi:MAG: hypothetical protein ACLTQI_04070 [Slackia sp.]